MKKLMTLMLGLAIVLGSTALFADDAATTTTKTKKTKATKTKATKTRKTKAANAS
jgi:Ni/Co efflux regulator RcnB